MKETINWFWNWEKKIWGDKVEANPYLASLSIVFAGVMGACTGGGNVFHAWFGWNTDVNYVAMGYLLILIWGMNFAESIVASKTAATVLGRSLLVLFCLAGFFAVGVIASVVVIVVVAAWLVLSFIGHALTHSGGGSGSGSSSSDPQQYGYDENGSQHTVRNEGGGYGRDENNRRLRRSGGKWEYDK